MFPSINHFFFKILSQLSTKKTPDQPAGVFFVVDFVNYEGEK